MAPTQSKRVIMRHRSSSIVASLSSFEHFNPLIEGNNRLEAYDISVTVMWKLIIGPEQREVSLRLSKISSLVGGPYDAFQRPKRLQDVSPAGFHQNGSQLTSRHVLC